MPAITIDLAKTTQFLVELLNTPSPTGYYAEGMAVVRQAFEALAIPNSQFTTTPKGTLLYSLRGQSSELPRGITAHVDTLGLMVKEIKSNGRIRPAKIGGLLWGGVEFEGVTVRTWQDQRYRGVCQPVNPSTHVNPDLHDAKRTDKTMEIRLDVRANSAEEIRQLGIEVGDFIFLDPRVEINNGFIRSRHLDDKAGIAAIYGALLAIQKEGLQLAQDTHILIANYEEIGHGGAAGLPNNLHELLTVDMAAIGEGQNSDIYSATICARDTSNIYHVDMIQKLRRLANEHQIPVKMDLYPHYSSDGGAYWKAGGAAKVGLIGPGVEASHSYERLHEDSLRDTAQLIAHYLLDTAQ